MLKVVIDTNLLIDGSGDDNNFGNRIIDEVIAGKISAFANRQTLQENRLISRQKISDADYRAKLENYFGLVRFVPRKERLNIVEDEEDNKLLESAVAASADYLISSDRHLLKIEEYQKIKIVSPSQFWAFYEDEQGGGWRNWINSFIKV
ncbi:MAG: putative toxin-antitoxin system toxin component, PIN family, partial [bacterium]|nr:putative toxin-antitoxin system toxin component, PIN family [bacterium]